MGNRFFKETIRDIDLRDQTVLVRTDYNVPMTSDGKISDDLRIRASLPTLKYLLEQNCKIIIISHLGRPKGRQKKYSLAPVAAHLADTLCQSVRFVDDCVGDKVRQMVRYSRRGSITMLENLRFYAEEEADDLTFARSIVKATGAEYFVQDGFGVVHRNHASTHAITLCIPGVAGFLLEKEYLTITRVIKRPHHPLVAIFGGAKVSDKIGLIHRLMKKADTVLIGGAMANTFLDYKGYDIGSSRAEIDQKVTLDEIYQEAREKVGSKSVDDFLRLPSDVAVAREPRANSVRREVGLEQVATDEKILDIGTQTIADFAEVIAGAKTVIWNGPLGYAEAKPFAIGSARTAMAIAQNSKATSIVGGGDTADFVLKWDGNDGASFTHVSTGGGASMELMAGKKLPGVESLLDSYGL